MLIFAEWPLNSRCNLFKGDITYCYLRDSGQEDYRRRRIAGRVQGQGYAGGQRGLEVRPDHAVRGPGEDLRAVQRQGPGGGRLPGQRLQGAGAGHERRDSELLHHQLRRQVPAV